MSDDELFRLIVAHLPLSESSSKKEFLEGIRAHFHLVKPDAKRLANLIMHDQASKEDLAVLDSWHSWQVITFWIENMASGTVIEEKLEKTRRFHGALSRRVVKAFHDSLRLKSS